MIEKPLAQFLVELSSSSPVPGGGAVAALAGSLAASLVSMVANLTCGKRGYEGVESEMHEVQAAAEELRDRLTELIEEDIAAFKAVMAAYRLPKEGPTRPGEIEEALKRACAVPDETAEHCMKTLELAGIVAERGNRNAVSDAGAAAALAAAGLEVALLNVEINLRSIGDEGFKREYQRRQEELAAAGAQLKGQALDLVQERLGG